jgi:hypothetical protein
VSGRAEAKIALKMASTGDAQGGSPQEKIQKVG